MKYAYMLSIFVCSISLGIILSYPHLTDFGSIVGISAACLSSFMIVGVLFEVLKRDRLCVSITDSLMNGMMMASYYHSSGTPLISSIRKAARECTNDKASIFLRQIASRIAMGESQSEAVKNVLCMEKTVYPMMLQYIQKPGFSFGEVSSIYSANNKEKASIAQALSARYATCNMFVTTVAPSFIMFSFIGNSLISQNVGSVEPMSIGLVCLVPLVYSFMNSTFARRWLG